VLLTLVGAASSSAGPSRATAPATTGGAAAPSHHQPALAVTGFQEEGDPNARIVHSAHALTTVGLDGVNLNPSGSSVGIPDAGARKVIALAHAHQLRAEFLIGNFGSGHFDERRAHRLLSNPDHIAAVSQSLVDSVTSQGWDGISVDLEALRSRDRGGLVRFVKALRDALPSGKSLSICVSNAEATSRYNRLGYDLSGLSAVVTRVILMAYDEHGSWENLPGPVGALTWQKRGLNALLRSVPPHKVDLGEAGYGYAWRPHSNYQVGDRAARRLAANHHVTPRFHGAIGEWKAVFPDGSTVWWADARSYRLRARLARHRHLHGLAVWSLGLSDRIR
jgi:spore germination protein YaaH